MSTYTLTFGDQAENHVGMQKIGELADEGFSVEDLHAAKELFEQDSYQCELILLHDVLDGECEVTSGVSNEVLDQAAILIVRDGVNVFVDADELFDEQTELDYDTKAFMYGRVVNKYARYNICFANFSQEPDYESKKGRIVSYDSVPLLQTIQQGLPGYLGQKAANLTIEGNHYYDVTTCGIGFHGDTERKKVVAIRLGNTAPLHYQWFKGNKPVGERVVLSIEHGDLYVMSEKAGGHDWKKKNIYTLRHAAGCSKYTTIKQK
jgi:hypothetical protein